MDKSFCRDGSAVRLDTELLHAVVRSKTKEELSAAATNFCAAHDLERWVYGMMGPDISLASYPVPWLNYYAKYRCHHGRDPFINTIRARRHAVAWDIDKNPPWKGPLDHVQKTLVDAKWDAGIRSGVTAPVFGQSHHGFDYAVISFSRDTPLTDTETRCLEPWVQLFATYFQSVASSVLLAEPHLSKTSVVLSQRERDCLSWAAVGKSTWEIGETLAISAATVKFHLAKAAAKLGTRGRVYSIAKAIRMGLINPT
jgi:DNA-binding CsgD family transcriptional regulator